MSFKNASFAQQPATSHSRWDARSLMSTRLEDSASGCSQVCTGNKRLDELRPYGWGMSNKILWSRVPPANSRYFTLYVGFSEFCLISRSNPVKGSSVGTTGVARKLSYFNWHSAVEKFEIVIHEDRWKFGLVNISNNCFWSQYEIL